MKKSQEAYKRALKQLDIAVKSARTAHQSEIDKLTAAQGAVDAFPRALDALQQAKKGLAEATLAQVKSGFRRKIETIYGEYDAAVAKIRQELCQALSDADVRTAADVDQRAVCLLQSNAMRGKDLLRMVEDFSESPAMRGLIFAEASRQLDEAAPDDPSREVLVQVMEAAKSDTEEYLAFFDDLTTAARTLAGRDKFGNFDRSAIFSSGLNSWETLTLGIVPQD